LSPNKLFCHQIIQNDNKKLIAIYEQKIKDEINKLWKKEPVKYEAGEGFSVAAEGNTERIDKKTPI
jgi:hypothetical protein